MKVFITGIAGFLGSHLADHYLQMGCDVAGIDNLHGGFYRNIPSAAQFLEADCNDRATYLKLLRGTDLVYHCASAAYDGLSVFSPAYVYRNTAQATVEVVSAAAAAGVPRFVFCSSMARYGNQSAPFIEEMEPRPVNPYGIAKVSAEQVVRNVFETHGGTYSIAVPHNIIGPRQRFNDPYRNVAAIMINRMLQGNQPVIYGDGSQRRCFSFVGDVLSCLVSMATSPNAAAEIINVGPDEETTTVLGLAQTLSEIMNFDLDPIFEPQRPLEVEHATCSSDKARRLLGYRTQTSLHAGLKEMVDAIAAVGPKTFVYGAEIEIEKSYTPRTWTERTI